MSKTQFLKEHLRDMIATYIEFLKDRHEIDNQIVITADERELLEVIAVCDHQDKPLTVTGFMAMTHLASPATLHRKMDNLIALNLVALHHKGKNRRTKYVKLTITALEYFAKAGAVLKMARAA